MKLMMLCGVLFGFILSSCSPPAIKHTVMQPSQLEVRDVDSVIVASFRDELNRNIPFPKGEGKKFMGAKGGIQPAITRFSSNQKGGSALVKASLISGLSNVGQYRILNTGTLESFRGVVPNAGKTAEIHARVRYFESIREGGERKNFSLSAQEKVPFGEVPNQRPLRKQYQETSPYVEMSAAMQVEFDFIRRSDGSKIVPTQVITDYYYGKWGGVSGSSSVPGIIKNAMVNRSKASAHLVSNVGRERSSSESLDEFLARGGNLPENAEVPQTSLDVKTRLSQQIANQYLMRIGRFSQVRKLVLEECGNLVGVNLIRASAFEHAVNYLEKLSDPDSLDIYNLGVAYEALGEAHQAKRYYELALGQDEGNELYEEALKRLR